MKKFTLYLLCIFPLSVFGTAGDSLFNTSQIHTIKFYFSQAKWYDSLIAYKPLDQKMKGDVMINGVMYPNVGVQFKGNSSFNNSSKKKSWKIDFNEYDTLQECNGEKTLNLNNGFKDPTLMREKVALDFCVKNGIPAPRCTYANVYVNDTLWGFYEMVEQADKTFLKHWFSDNDGNLFKGDNNGTLQWYGSAASSYYGKYELKTNKTLNDWTDLVHLIDEINNTPSTDFYDSLEVILNTPLAIRAWAMNILFANLDSYQGSGHNYYIFHDSTYNKFNWITWDVNEVFGNFNMGMNISQLENLSIYYIPSPATNRPLENKMLADTYYKNAYTWEVCNFVANDFDTAVIFPWIDSIANVIRPFVYADPNKFFPNSQFESNIITDNGNIPGLKKFLTNRRASVLTELANNGCFMGTNELQISDFIHIYPNPMLDKATLEVIDNQSSVVGGLFKLYDILGKEVMQLPITDYRLPITRGNLNSGIYFYQAISPEGIQGSGKLVIE